jgi:hypothetical protein
LLGDKSKKSIIVEIKGVKMWIWIDAVVKPNKTSEEVRIKREEWIGQGKEEFFMTKCKSAERFSISDSFPQRVFWLMETEDKDAAESISRHFGDVWDIKTYQVSPQSISKSLEDA